MTDELYIQAILHNLKLHAFVVMPNHFHLLLTVPSGQLDRPMKGLMESSTRIINARSRRSGHLYGGRYHWSLIRSPLYFAHALKYIYRNPVKAEISDCAEKYPYSTFQVLFGHCKPPIPLAAPPSHVGSSIPADLWDLKNWIETPYANEESEAIRRALRRKEFTLPLDPSKRKPLAIEDRI